MRLTSVVALAISICCCTTIAFADTNPLLGHWTFNGQGYVDQDRHNWCNVIVELDFDANSKTMITSNPPSNNTTPAFYAVYGTTIYVSSTEGLIEGPYYTILDGNHMRDENSIGRCVYQRG